MSTIHLNRPVEHSQLVQIFVKLTLFIQVLILGKDIPLTQVLKCFPRASKNGAFEKRPLQLQPYLGEAESAAGSFQSQETSE